MASVLTKNSGLSCRYKFDVLNPAPVIFLPENTSGVAASLTLSASWQAMTLPTGPNTLGIGRVSKFFLAQPSALDFTVTGAGTPAQVAFDYEISGLDHFGEPISDIGSKVVPGSPDATHDVVCRTYRVFSVINSISVRRTDAIGGTYSVQCGVSTATGPLAMVRPLPLKLNSSTSIAGIVLVTPGGVTYGSWATCEVKAVNGYVGLTSEDTPFTVNNAKGWTPRRLAQVGCAQYSFSGLRYTSALPTPQARFILTADALVGT